MKVFEITETALLNVDVGREKKKPDQAKGSDPMPKKVHPTMGPTQKHPLRGKLVGG
jgi:hypothetical protein